MYMRSNLEKLLTLQTLRGVAWAETPQVSTKGMVCSRGFPTCVRNSTKANEILEPQTASNDGSWILLWASNASNPVSNQGDTKNTNELKDPTIFVWSYQQLSNKVRYSRLWP